VEAVLAGVNEGQHAKKAPLTNLLLSIKQGLCTFKKSNMFILSFI